MNNNQSYKKMMLTLKSWCKRRYNLFLDFYFRNRGAFSPLSHPYYSLNCGIAGFIEILASYPLEQWVRKLKEMSLTNCGIESFVAQKITLENYAGTAEFVTQCEQLCQALTELHGRNLLHQSPDIQKAIESLTHRIGEFLENEEQIREHQAQNILFPDLEKINRVILQLKDIHWKLRMDILGNLSKIDALSPIPLKESSVYLQFARLNAILNTIDRLEIRGRDSAGVGIQVTFPSLEARSQFLEGYEKEAVQKRLEIPNFSSQSIRIIPQERVISLTFKIAKAVGELGENVRKLREVISGDSFLAALFSQEGIQVSVLSHTRWASNGVISEPNCHPIDNEILSNSKVEESTYLELQNPHYPDHRRTHIQVVLNGDIDNYPYLRGEFEKNHGKIPPKVTTDAKIISLQVNHYLHAGHTLQDSFRLAFNDFEGSFAIALISDLEPSKVLLGVRGSGQGLYIGLLQKGYNFASEMYGIVEETSNYLSLDGHAKSNSSQMCPEGQIAILDQNSAGGIESIDSLYCDGTKCTDLKVKKAEITTRDIDRQNFEHFFYKEITSAPISVRNTLRGKFEIKDSEVSFNLGEETFPQKLQQDLLENKIKKIYLVGQGTASIAANAIAYLLQQYLETTSIQIQGMKATELSGLVLPDDMKDCLLVAVSQSGTTTDTNRAVDMVSERRAHTACIVNRRNSQITEKVDGIFFTADGRDVEMSVASTKAFYSQVVAGAIYGLRIATLLNSIEPSKLKSTLEQWKQLPQLMEKVLANQDAISQSASQFGLSKVNWAVVGSGANFIAAQEIRIKLSELCYKSISCDLVEDKKHIDLSSEPLIFMLAAGANENIFSDLVKEVGIFKAHKSVPIVVNFSGNKDFDEHASAVLSIPRCPSELAMILNTMIGHLWGYYVARAINTECFFFQEIRDEVGKLRGQLLENPESEEEVLEACQANFMEYEIKFWERLKKKRFNASLSLETGIELANLLHWLAGGASFESMQKIFKNPINRPLAIIEQLLSILNQAIEDLSRPIDAIKHQAKTVTVGTSRLETFPEGVLSTQLQKLKLSPDHISFQNRSRLKLLQEAVKELKGWTLYEIANLDRRGNPTEETTISIRKKTGISKSIPSRVQQHSKLQGTKSYVVHHKTLTVGLGQRDKRFIAILPIQSNGQAVDLLFLCHLDLKSELPTKQKVQILQKFEKFEEVKTICEELGIEWKNEYLSEVLVQQLFSEDPGTLARIITSKMKMKTS